MFLPSVSRAQSSSAGTIAGVVKDATGAVLPGVTVEASSPALIEKVRTVTTDDQGQYKIIELRPGTYTVTFSLTGFTTIKREGLALTTGFTATENADMSVGSLQETVTVSGASPVVDIQNVRTQTLLTAEVFDSLPTAKGFRAFAALTLGASLTSGRQDVGGNQGEVVAGFAVHGGRTNDSRMMEDGMQMHGLEAGAGGRRNFVNQASIQETTVQTGGMSAESETGGVQVNLVPKEGGNRFAGYSAATYTNNHLQNSNFSDELKARGLTEPSKVKRIYDVAPAGGGPIMKDRLWFYTAHRWTGAQNNAPANYFNSTPNTIFYTADLGRPAYTDTWGEDHSLRLTWQVSPKNKVTVLGDVQDNCQCYFFADQSFAPDATIWFHFTPVHRFQGTWTYPVTSKLLIEAGGSYLRTDNQIERPPFVSPDAIPITDTGTGYNWGSSIGVPGGAATLGVSTQKVGNQRVAVSYVTGSHAFKFGLSALEAIRINSTDTNSISYTFRFGAPTSLTLYATPHYQDIRIMPNLGLYAQDQWTVQRLTLNLGVRFDRFRSYNPASTRPAGRFVSEFNFPKVDNVPSWKDVSPRLGAAYDLFGNGKTALKVSLGRFVESQTSVIANANHPANTIVTTVTRTWDDNFYDVGDPRRQNFVPDCDLQVRVTDGECGPYGNMNFGTTVVSTRYDDDILHGARPYNWQSSVSVQHELRRNVAVSVGYFRTWYGNFTVTDNLSVTPSNFDTYCVRAPVDVRLPGGGGYDMCGRFDVNRALFGRSDNLVTQASTFGKRTEVYDGVDVALNARFGRGAMLSGGFNTGQTVTDGCDVIVDSPDTLYCRQTLPFAAQTQVKFTAVYPLPFWDLQASANFQSLPGIPILANVAFSNAQIAPSLGRNLAACPAATGACSASVPIQVIEPNTMLEDRLNQVDVRFTKIVRVGRIRIQGMFDIYNLFNAGTILARNNTYGTAAWGRPTAILGARLFKVGTQVDF